jgi:hypothetical protein
MNTVFTCENMINTLDKMLAVIESEMPRQIDRWGGSMNEWKDNVEQLKEFIFQRCELLDDGALECYEELSGPYSVTLLTSPDSIAEIDFNTLDIESFPWTGDYFGGMEQLIKTKAFDEFEENYIFSHWESTAGNMILDSLDRRTSFFVDQPDTLIAVYDFISSTLDLALEYDIRVFPNPTEDRISINYELPKSATVRLELYSVTGQLIEYFSEESGDKGAGVQTANLSLEQTGIPAGLYFLNMTIDETNQVFKISLIK